MAVVKATIKKRTGTSWDEIRPKTEVAQIPDIDSVIPDNIEDLDNVTISSPSSGQVLKYNGSVWANAADNNTDTNTTYSIKASSQTGGAGLDLDAGGSGSGTDTVVIKGGGGTTVSRTDANTITINSINTGGGLSFEGSISLSTSKNGEDLKGLISSPGDYLIVSSTGNLVQSENLGDATLVVQSPGDEGNSTLPVTLEAGDWIIFQDYDLSSDTITVAVINNNDARFANYVAKSGDTMTGDLTIGANTIYGNSTGRYLSLNGSPVLSSVANIEIRADDDDSSTSEYLKLMAGQNTLEITSSQTGTDNSKLTYNGNQVLTSVTGTKKYTWQPDIVYWNNGGTGAGFRNILKVESSSLSTGGILYVDGTSGSVVVNAKFEILVNHYQDIVVKSLSGGYTAVEIKILSDYNDEFNLLIARERDDTNETPITATFIPYDQNATVTTYTNNPAVTYDALTHTHRTRPFSENITATGGSTGKLYVEGNEVWHAGNAADADGKVSKSGDTMTSNLSFTNTTNIGVQNAAATAWFRPEDLYGNVHIQSKDTKGIYLDTDVFYLRERGNTSNVVLYSNLSNVGIGTTSPGTKLDVNGAIRGYGSIRVNEAADGNPYFALYQDGTEKAYIQYLDQGTSTDRLVIQSDGNFHFNGGNVGIGTTSPNTKLDINGRLNLDTDLIRFRTVNSSSWNTTLQGTSLGKIEWYTDDASGNGPMPLARIDAINNASSQYLPEAELAFFTAPYNDASPNERMRIDVDGNVGIGTTSPSEKLEVNGSFKAGGFSATDTDEWPNFYWLRGVAGWDEGLIKGSSSRGVFGKAHFGIHFDDDRSFAFHTSSWDTEMEINGDGTIYMKGPVGIGTASPNVSLEVNGDVRLSGDSRRIDLARGTTSSQPKIIVGEQGTYGLQLRWDSGTKAYFDRFWSTSIDGTPSSQMMTFDLQNDRVGIGTTGPGNKLSVGGNIDSSGIEIGTAQYAQAIDSKSSYLLLQRDQGVPIELWGSTVQSRSVHRFFTTAQFDTEINFLRGSSEYSNYIRAQNYPSRGYTSSSQKYWIEYGSKGGHHFVVDTDGGTSAGTNNFDNFTVFKGEVDGPTLFQVNNGGDTLVAGNLDVVGSIYDNDANLLRIIKPKGGSYSGGSSHTGAIGITLPAGTRGSATMMSMFIDVYDYAGGSDGESWTIQVGGYNYTGSQWYNVFANLVSGRPDRFFTVRFSHDAGSNTETIWIGENNSSWSYPQIQVRDVIVGHSGDQDADWHNNAFNVTIGTIIGSVTMSKTAENYASDSLRLSGYVPTENAAANSIAKRNGDGDLTVTDLFANGAVYANSNKLAWVKNGSTVQSGVTFSLQSGVLYITTSLT